MLLGPALSCAHCGGVRVRQYAVARTCRVMAQNFASMRSSSASPLSGLAPGCEPQPVHRSSPRFLVGASRGPCRETTIRSASGHGGGAPKHRGPRQCDSRTPSNYVSPEAILGTSSSARARNDIRGRRGLRGRHRLGACLHRTHRGSLSCFGRVSRATSRGISPSRLRRAQCPSEHLSLPPDRPRSRRPAPNQ